VNNSLVQDIFYAARITIHLVKIHVTKELQDYYGHPQTRHLSGFELVQSFSKAPRNSPGQKFQIISHIWPDDGV